MIFLSYLSIKQTQRAQLVNPVPGVTVENVHVRRQWWWRHERLSAAGRMIALTASFRRAVAICTAAARASTLVHPTNRVGTLSI